MKLSPWHQKQLVKIESITDISGKIFVEIGGDLNSDVLKYAIHKGAKKAIGFNPKYKAKSSIPNIELVQDYFDEKAVNYVIDGADIIFGAAVLEHVNDFNSLFMGIQSIFNNRGIGLLHGGPIWTSNVGHHVWVNSSNTWYTFNNALGGKNPINPWEHLILNQNEMLDTLIKQRNIAMQDALKIVEWIYNSTALNRISYNSLRKLFDSTAQVNLIGIDEVLSAPPTVAIAERITSTTNYEYNELRVAQATFLFSSNI